MWSLTKMESGARLMCIAVFASMVTMVSWAEHVRGPINTSIPRQSSENADYPKLNQAWSHPTLTKIKVGEDTKNVIIIGGGDASQATKTVRSADSVGNAIYIIDADNGAVLFVISAAESDVVTTEMIYAITGRIAAVDRDEDGYVDHLYAADTGGQLFRYDIYNGQTGIHLINGQRIADFGGDTEASHRPFYAGPDIVAVSQHHPPFFAIALGSGQQLDALNTSLQNSFYVYRDESVFMQDEYGRFVFPEAVVRPNHLYDATEHLLSSDNDWVKAAALAALQDKQGWRIDLSDGGERVLNSPLIVNYQVFFTTYIPAASQPNLATSATGNARAYLVNVFTGSAVTDLDDNNKMESIDRYAPLNQAGIPLEPSIVFKDMAEPSVCMGTECVTAAIVHDRDGNAVPCASEFACLARHIYGRFKRVQPQAWTTTIERQ